VTDRRSSPPERGCNAQDQSLHVGHPSLWAVGTQSPWSEEHGEIMFDQVQLHHMCESLCAIRYTCGTTATMAFALQVVTRQTISTGDQLRSRRRFPLRVIFPRRAKRLPRRMLHRSRTGRPGGWPLTPLITHHFDVDAATVQCCDSGSYLGELVSCPGVRPMPAFDPLQTLRTVSSVAAWPLAS